jgi:hypothetical protein
MRAVKDGLPAPSREGEESEGPRKGYERVSARSRLGG